MSARGAARAFLAAAVVAGGPARGALSERALPAGHPCLLADAVFSPLHEERGVSVGLARLPGGSVVVRARATLDARPLRVAALLEEVDLWPAWIRRLRSLERLPGDLPAFHAVFRAPWPLRDRDYVFAPFAERRPDSTAVFWEDASDRLPAPHPGRTRVSPVRGCFAVTPGPTDDASALAYTELDSFAGSLPAWMRGAGRTTGPVRLVEGLRARLREN